MTEKELEQQALAWAEFADDEYSGARVSQIIGDKVALAIGDEHCISLDILNLEKLKATYLKAKELVAAGDFDDMVFAYYELEQEFREDPTYRSYRE